MGNESKRTLSQTKVVSNFPQAFPGIGLALGIGLGLGLWLGLGLGLGFRGKRLSSQLRILTFCVFVISPSYP